jgi:hypothetical protein
MPLEESCEKYRGEMLFVLPVVGYGWCQIAPGTPRYEHGTPLEPPPPFYARVMEFHRFLGKIRAGIAVIEQQCHPLEKQWLAFCVRDGMGNSVHNLTNNPAEYNLRIGKERPTINIDPENLAMPEWMRFEGSICLSGLGYIIESAASLEEIQGRIAMKD